MMLGIAVMLMAGIGLIITGLGGRQSATMDDETAEYLRQTTAVRSSPAQMRKVARIENRMQDKAKYGVVRIAAGATLVLLGIALLVFGIY